MSYKKKDGPAMKNKGAKLPRPQAGKMGEVDKAPATSGQPVPSSTAPASVSRGDGDGQKIAVTSEMAKMAPSAKGSKKPQGEAMELPKVDSEDRHY